MLRYNTNLDVGPGATSDTVDLNGFQWFDTDANGVPDGWTLGHNAAAAVTTEVVSTVRDILASDIHLQSFLSFSGKYQEIAAVHYTDPTDLLNLTFPNSVVAGTAYELSFHYTTNFSEIQIHAGNYLNSNREGESGDHWSSPILRTSNAAGVIHGYLGSHSDPSSILIEQVGWYHVTFRSPSSGGLTITMKSAAISSSNNRVIFRVDNLQMTTVYSSVGSRSTWQEASDRCSNRDLKLCERSDYCPNGPGTPPIGGSFLTQQTSSISNSIERWAPFDRGDGSKYSFLKLEHYEGVDSHGLRKCHDSPPPGRYTCAEHLTFGNCTKSFMNLHCCSSCFSCSHDCKKNHVSWTKVVSNGAYGAVNIGRDMVDQLFALSGTIGTKIFARDCFDCTSDDHKLIFYKRLTSIPSAFSIYEMFSSNFVSENNVLDVDFELYSSYQDAVAGSNKWISCGYGGSGLGFPGTCGPSTAATGQWNNLDGAASGVSNYGYWIVSSPSSVCIENSTLIRSGFPYQGFPPNGADSKPTFPAEFSGEFLCCENKDACDAPLGMESGIIADSQLSDTGASSLSQKRLNVVVSSSNGWIFPGPAGLLHPFGTSYYQVDLLRTVSLSGVGTQGRGDKNQWVTSYKVAYTEDRDGVVGWKYVQIRDKQNAAVWIDHLLLGNVDSNTVVKNTFRSPVVARHVRVYPMSAQSITALRLELYGGDVGRCG